MIKKFKTFKVLEDLTLKIIDCGLMMTLKQKATLIMTIKHMKKALWQIFISIN